MVDPLPAGFAERFAAAVAGLRPPLSAAQRAAASCVAPVTVSVACAGAGKTTVLASRAAALVEAGAEPSSVCLLCFGRAAADVMRERLGALLGARAEGVHVSTVHSVARSAAVAALGEVPRVHPAVARQRDEWHLWRALVRAAIVRDPPGAWAEPLSRWLVNSASAPPAAMGHFATVDEWRAAQFRLDRRDLAGTVWPSADERQLADWLRVMVGGFDDAAAWRIRPHGARPDGFQWEGARVEVVRADRVMAVVGVVPARHDGRPLPWPGVAPALAEVLVRFDRASVAVPWRPVRAGALMHDPLHAAAEALHAAGLVDVPTTVPPGGWDRVWYAYGDARGLDRTRRGKRLLELLGRLVRYRRVHGDVALPAHLAPLGLVADRLGGQYDSFLALGLRVHDDPRASADAPRMDGETVDFDDYLVLGLGAVAAGADVGRWRHLLVDEYQDFTPAMERFLGHLAVGASTVFVVGDPRQSIFRFTGATGGQLFGRDVTLGGQPVTLRPLRESFRCPARVAAVGSAVLALGSTFGASSPMQPAGDEPGRVVLALPADGVQLPAPRGPAGISDGASARTNRYRVLDAVLHDVVDTYGPGPDHIARVLLLSRYHRTQRWYGVAGSRWQPFRRAWAARGLALDWLTIHQAKGDEAPHVVLLDCCEGQYGFPSTDVDELFVGAAPAGPRTGVRPALEEERRLLHVAVTRASRSVHVTVGDAPASVFAAGLALIDSVDVVPIGGLRGAHVGAGSCPQCAGRYWDPVSVRLRVCRTCGFIPPAELDHLRGAVAEAWATNLVGRGRWHPV